MDYKVQTGFLFARPSFTAGAASTLDLWGQFAAYNRSETSAEADANAIFADWAVVGQDISDAMDGIQASERDAA
jgi:hypothetical protein